MPDLAPLISDLEAEHSELDALVGAFSGLQWDEPTPARGWTVRDQISHLAFFDEAASSTVTDPDGFVASLSDAATDVQAYMKAPLLKGRVLPAKELLEWWRGARSGMLAAFAGLQGPERIVWYGPAMSAASFITARLMETWAHGQDVIDAIGKRRVPTDRLKHVAHLGFRARPFSYIANSLDVPTGNVRVELVSPSGRMWTFGESEIDLVLGSALDFCLVVAQRRNIADTGLEISGPLATEWMSIAQCFAGPPGEGRRPGQFPRGA